MLDLGMKLSSLKDILNNDNLDKEIVYVEEGRTSTGYEFATVRIYLKEHKAGNK
jgi:hypothetical protein